MKTEFFYVKLRAICPIHIGCAEVYEPTSFYVDKKANQLVHFDTNKFVDMLEEQDLKKLSSICKKGTLASIIELMRFIQKQASDIQIEGLPIPLATGLLAHFEQTLSIGTHDHRRLKNEINNFQIMRSSFDPLTGELYIPGSAIKGAIRTAVLNYRHRSNKIPPKRYSKMKPREVKKEAQKIEKRLLHGSFSEDPFRLLKISDFFPANQVRRKIVYAIDKKKEPSRFESQAPYQILEVIEPGSEFIGFIAIQEPVRPGLIKQPLTKKEIIEALNTFYTKELDRENSELSHISINQTRIGQGLPIRIGRHSGAECVTVEGHRSIKIMQGKGNDPKHLDHATTVWVAAESKRPSNNSGLRPFGWMAFLELEKDRWLECLDHMEYTRKSFEQESEHIIAELARHQAEEEAKRAEEERRRQEAQRAAEEKARKEAEERARREAELAKLPEELAWLVRREEEHNWNVDNNALLTDLEKFFEKFPESTREAIDHVAKWLEEKWPKILENPDATKGKKKKPKYKDRPRNLAKKVLELR